MVNLKMEVNASEILGAMHEYMHFIISIIKIKVISKPNLTIGSASCQRFGILARNYTSPIHLEGISLGWW